MSKGYSKNKLFQIGKENYRTLAKYCDILFKESYWEKPEAVLGRSISEMMDLYIQAVLVQLTISCGCFNLEERKYIAEIPEQNVIAMSLDDEDVEEIIYKAHTVFKAPPIILQLFSLRDIERSTSMAGMFFDALLNILLAMAYLNNSKNVKLTGFILGYFHQVSAFLNTNSKINYVINEKYVFLKISSDELELSNALLLTADGDFERYKDNFLFNTDKVRIKVPKLDALRNEVSVHKKNEYDKNKHDENEDIQDNNGDSQDKLSLYPCKKEVENTEVRNQQENLGNLLLELNELIGLDTVKSEINSLINLIKVRKLREEFNMPAMDMSYHMVYTGNPGTGKTTVARLVAKIYKELGILTEGNLVETDRSGLVAGYVGQTALKVKEVAERAIGGVLFIDEAYALSSGIGTNDFGGEAIDTLVKIMEDHRDNLVVIVAGYRDEMQQFLRANTGLVSRFNKFIDFDDYTDEELIAILNSMAQKAGYKIEKKAFEAVKNKLADIEENARKQFGNARGIRNVFEKIVMNQANRIVTYLEPTMEQLSEIICEDVNNVL